MGAGYGWQYEVLACPFCDEGEISCRYYMPAVSVKRSITASLPMKGSPQKSKGVWIIQTGCPKCGKTKDEIEQKLKEKGII